MTKRINAKHKIERRYGTVLWDQEKSPVSVRSYAPGQHGTKPQKRGTEYKEQLSSKQILKGFYGDMPEKQFARLVKEAQEAKGHAGDNLIAFLESRLDAFVFRAKWAVTPFMARQMVNHKHVSVNGRKVNIRSYRLRVGDVVTLDDTMKKSKTVITAEESKREVPGYIESSGFEAKLVRLPETKEVPFPFVVNTQSIIEYYSR
jgi:small subunit ribosomal protein S4